MSISVSSYLAPFFDLYEEPVLVLRCGTSLGIGEVSPWFDGPYQFNVTTHLGVNYLAFPPVVGDNRGVEFEVWKNGCGNPVARSKRYKWSGKSSPYFADMGGNDIQNSDAVEYAQLFGVSPEDSTPIVPEQGESSVSVWDKVETRCNSTGIGSTVLDNIMIVVRGQINFDNNAFLIGGVFDAGFSYDGDRNPVLSDLDKGLPQDQSKFNIKSQIEARSYKWSTANGQRLIGSHSSDPSSVELRYFGCELINYTKEQANKCFRQITGNSPLRCTERLVQSFSYRPKTS